MKPFVVVVVLALHACSPPAPASVAPSAAAAVAGDRDLLALADSIFAAARDRNADRFAGFFSTRPDFVYLINTRRIGSQEALRSTFHTMLSRQAAFDVRWGERTVQVLTPTSGVLTGAFRTRARQVNGEEWEAGGVVTFAAVREAAGWRVVNWHTTEPATPAAPGR